MFFCKDEAAAIFGQLFFFYLMHSLKKYRVIQCSEPLSARHEKPGKESREAWQKKLFLIKFSSLSAPTKVEELTAGSDEKNTAQPRRESNPGSIFVGAEREENLIRSDPDKSEFTNYFSFFWENQI